MATLIKLNRVAMFVAGSSAFFAGASFAAFDLTGIGYVQYGDAQSYSLPIASIQNGCTGPGCTFYVASSPGAIKDLTVLGTGASGTPVVTNFTGMDNAYSTPNGSGEIYWAPSAATSNGQLGTVNNNGANTWDSSLLALRNYLAGEQMIFFFNNNQENSLGTAAQSLAAWAQITIKNAAGAVINTYDLTNRGTTAGAPGAYNLVSNGGGGTFNGSVANYTSAGPGNPVAGTNASTDYVLSGGAVCVTLNTVVPVPTACNPANPNLSSPINHNLGANQAAYALLFPELNTRLSGLFSSLTTTDLGLYTMSVDIRLGCDPTIPLASRLVTCTTGSDVSPVPYGRSINNGYEQVFISTARDVVNVDVPEPGTLALAGLALLGLAFARRRA